MTPEIYPKLLQETVTKKYKKATQKVGTSIILEGKNTIDVRVECLAKTEASISLKNHKDNFLSYPTFRLLNPCKCELEKTSKSILEEVNNTIKVTLNLNQWKNTNEIIDWFININSKH